MNEYSFLEFLIVTMQENMMTASNLSICVGPSILWSSDQAYMMDQNYSKEVNHTCILTMHTYKLAYLYTYLYDGLELQQRGSHHT